MEKIFAELTDENGEYQMGIRWQTRHVIDLEAKKWIDIEDETHDTFEYDGVSFWWYHAKNKDAQHPVLVASWSVQLREDDFNEYEEEIDADADSVHSLLERLDKCGGRLEWED
jgi:hypothetical protein